jgi:hypothetical protein
VDKNMMNSVKTGLREEGAFEKYLFISECIKDADRAGMTEFEKVKVRMDKLDKQN